MAFVVVRHRVNDYAAWKQAFTEAKGMRKAAGEEYYQIFQQEDDPNHVVGLFRWDSSENARKFFTSTELVDAMWQAGVADTPDIYHLEEVAQGHP